MRSTKPYSKRLPRKLKKEVKRVFEDAAYNQLLRTNLHIAPHKMSYLEDKGGWKERMIGFKLFHANKLSRPKFYATIS